MMVLQANTAVIVAVAVLLVIVLLLVLKRRKGDEKPASEGDAGTPTPGLAPPPPRRTIASKETFAPAQTPTRIELETAPSETAPVAEVATTAVEKRAEADANVETAKTDATLDLPAAKPDLATTTTPELDTAAGVAETVAAPNVSTATTLAAEPVPAEPVKAEKAKAEPAKAEKAKAEPAKAEKAKAEPAKAEKAKVEPAKAEKAKAEPAKAEKAKVEPAKAEKAKAEKPGKKKADDDIPWELRDDDEPETPKAPVVAEPTEDAGPERTLKDGLGRTRKEGFIARLGNLFKRGKAIDDDLMDEVEEVLFTADIGVKTADRLMTRVRTALSSKELKDEDKVWSILRDEALAILSGPSTAAAARPANVPEVIMVLGVNGTGKTTSIGKLANHLRHEGRKVLLVAGDTFRAAAAEQLEHWGRRVGVEVFRGKEGQDPASVVFDGVKKGLDDRVDTILVDTAGRLHNNTNLMEELKKVRRVMGRAIEAAPHEVLLVLDATTGQNAVVQARQFKDATEVTGVVLTKLDGTAKGGVMLGVCDELKIPVRWVGVGERVADIRGFDAREFVDELFRPPT